MSMDYGKEYKVKLTALLTLQCLNEDLTEFIVLNDADGFHYFNDIILYKKYKNNTSTAFLLQVKHRVYRTRLKKEEFINSRQFNLSRYFYYQDTLTKPKNDVYKCIISANKLYRIIFTNRIAENDQHITEVDNIDLKQINLSGNVYKINSYYEKYKEDVYLLSGQQNLRNLNSRIVSEIQKSFNKSITSSSSEVASKFISYIHAWSKITKSRTVLNKSGIINQLTKICIEPFIDKTFCKVKVVDGDKSSSMHKWELLIHNKDITMIDMNNTNELIILQFLKAYIIYILNRFVEISIENKAEYDFFKERPVVSLNVKSSDLMLEIHKSFENNEKLSLFYIYNLLWKMKIIPLIINIHETKEYEYVINILKLSDYMLHVIVLNYSHCTYSQTKKDPRLFTNLSDLNEQECKGFLDKYVGLQDKPTPFYYFIEKFKNLKRNIDTKTIIYILLHIYNIGNILNEIPNNYNKRSILRFLDCKRLLEQLIQCDDLCVIEGETQESFHRKLKFDIQLPRHFIEDDDIIQHKQEISNDCKIFLTLNVPNAFLKKISTRNIHYLKFFNGNMLGLINTIGNLKNIASCSKSSLILSDDFIHLKPIQIKIFDQNVVSKLEDPIKIIVTQSFLPEKTTLMNFISGFNLEKKDFINIINLPTKTFYDLFNPAQEGSIPLDSSQVNLETVSPSTSTINITTTNAAIKNFQINPEKLFHIWLINETSVIPNPGEVRIIAGLPGIGKTVEIDCIARTIPPTFWVLQVRLRLYMNYFRSEEFQTSTSRDRLKYLNDDILKQQQVCAISSEVFECFLDSNDVVILFDGLDEISPVDLNNVTNMILTLKKDRYRIWLTTRLVLKKYAEENFGTEAKVLPKFLEIEQSIFLEKHFIFNNKSVICDRYKTNFMQYIKSTIDTTFGHYQNSLLSIPLHIQLIADFFIQFYNDYFMPNYSANKVITIKQLCEMLISKKNDILDAKYQYAMRQMNSLFDSIKNEVAVQCISKLTSLTNSEVQSHNNNFIELIQKDGILITEDESNNLVFIDQLFAEYYTTQWMLQCRSEQDKRKVKELTDLNYGIINKITNKINTDPLTEIGMMSLFENLSIE